jgi:hypothetical protein
MPNDPRGKDARRDREGGAKEAATAVVNAAGTIAAGALAVGATPATSVGLAVGAGLITAVTGRLTGWQSRKRERRVVAWIGAYVEGSPDLDPELVEAEIHAKAEHNPVIQEVILEGARAIDEALADVVLPTLARLTRSYRVSERPADAFFRGVRRMLSDLDGEEFAAFTLLIKRLLSDDRVDTVEYFRLEIEGKTGEVERWHVVTTPEGKQGGERMTCGDIPHALRLFHLLKVNGLGADSSVGGFSAGAGPEIVHIQSAILKRLAAVVL